ncbi:MAG: M16 family metallopeptidase, partial [Nitrospirota bacterium]
RFRPEGALLSVCGSFSNKEAVKIAQNAFKGWAGSGKPYNRDGHKTAFNPGKTLELQSKPGTAGALFAFKFPPPGSPDYAAALTARAILAEGMSSMIYKSLRGKEPEAYQFGSLLRWVSASPVMTVYSVTDETRIDGAIDGIKGSIEALEEGKFSSEELERGRAFALGGIEFSSESAEKVARLAGLYEIGGAGENYADRLPGEFSGVGKGDVERAARRYLAGFEMVTMKPRKEQE